VFAPDGTRLAIIRTPEVPANLAFGGPDLRTLFFTARTSVYSLRAKVPGQPHPWYRARGR
jgi:gluconolactonase